MSKQKEIWRRITTHFASILPAEDFETWFSKLKPLSLSPELAVIRVPNKYHADWIEERYLPEIQDLLEQALLSRPAVRLDCEYMEGSDEAQFSPHSPQADGLNPKMTFESFFRADSNLFAYSCCREMVERPTRTYNPLYLFSSHTAGKTHLLHAVGNLIQQRRGYNHRILYLHAERFASAFSQAARYRRVHLFRELFLDLDLLLVDDVHLLAGRPRTQEELTLILDSLIRKRKALVISSSDVPSRLPDSQDRLKSILAWGLLAEIHPPEVEIRAKIIRHRTRQARLPLPDDVVEFLAQSNKDMKDLLREVTRLQSILSIRGDKTITVDSVMSIIGKTREIPPQAGEIKALTAAYFNLSLADLVSGKRHKSYAYPRHIAMYLCRRYTNLSYKNIGAAFANRDHSTVLHSVHKIENQKDINDNVKEDLKNLETLILEKGKTR